PYLLTNLLTSLLYFELYSCLFSSFHSQNLNPSITLLYKLYVIGLSNSSSIVFLKKLDSLIKSAISLLILSTAYLLGNDSTASSINDLAPDNSAVFSRQLCLPIAASFSSIISSFLEISANCACPSIFTIPVVTVAKTSESAFETKVSSILPLPTN